MGAGLTGAVTVVLVLVGRNQAKLFMCMCSCCVAMLMGVPGDSAIVVIMLLEHQQKQIQNSQCLSLDAVHMRALLQKRLALQPGQWWSSRCELQTCRGALSVNVSNFMFARTLTPADVNTAAARCAYALLLWRASYPAGQQHPTPLSVYPW